MVEFRLLRDCGAWTYKAEENASREGTLKEVEFFADLCEDLIFDMREVYEEYAENNGRHGKSVDDKRDLEREVFRLVDEMDGGTEGEPPTMDGAYKFIGYLGATPEAQFRIASCHNH